MMGTKPSWATLATFCGSVTPSNRRTATYIALAYLLHIEGGTGRPRLKLINVPSVKGCKASRNFGELRNGEVRRILLLSTSACCNEIEPSSALDACGRTRAPTTGGNFHCQAWRSIELGSETNITAIRCKQ